MGNETTPFNKKPMNQIFTCCTLFGFGIFAALVANNHSELAWPAYLINILLWSAIAQGGLLFSMVMHMTKARWSNSLSALSEAFALFFPASFALFFLLYLGSDDIFPWLHEDLHGKEVWLNIPFLFSRDLAGLLFLYGVGMAYLYYALGSRLDTSVSQGKFRRFIYGKWPGTSSNSEKLRAKKSVFSVLYMVAFAFVLSLIAFDMVMSADPHWISTLFGAYGFIKAFYIGLGALIILAAVIYLRDEKAFGLQPSHFHDIGKLFFGFCLIWGDFFYAQFLVIWYGNIPEETSYIIERTMLPPWNVLAWIVLAICFIIPFLILLNRRIKTMPFFMSALCAIVIFGILLEHVLLLGPVLSTGISIWVQIQVTVLIAIGFFGLMGLSLGFYFHLFPEVLNFGQQEFNKYLC